MNLITKVVIITIGTISVVGASIAKAKKIGPCSQQREDDLNRQK